MVTIAAMKKPGRPDRLWRIVRWRRTWFVAAWMLTVHLAGSAAWAQRAAQATDEGKGLLQWGIAAGLAIVVCIAAFLSPKRKQPAP
jgi:hypothetical protein